jgi:NAD(P)-dependent dehydrogenase (short-subunit alcohol dehydrogenase family)
VAQVTVGSNPTPSARALAACPIDEAKWSQSDHFASLDRMNLSLDGKVAVVTGGSRGIGRAVAQGMAEAGASVVIASRKLDSCERAAEEIAEATGARTLPVAFHAGRWEDAERLADTVYGEFGRCDVLMNNAGMSPVYADLPSVTAELYDKVHAVNARGPFRLSALVGTRMAEADGGVILNVTTTGTLRPTANELPYAMAKAGLNALTLALAGTWAPKVRANLLVPGAFDTDIAEHWPPGMREAAAQMNPLGRIGVPQDVVGIAVLLASDAGSYINGAQILLDGGLYRSL